MPAETEYDDYLLELRETVCSHCIEHHPDGPPCTPLGKACGIEEHFPKLVDICLATDSVQMEPYVSQLHDKICTDCAYRDAPTCPCPLGYLLQLAVEAIERVQRRRNAQPAE